MSKLAGDIRKLAPYLTLGIQIMLTFVVPVVVGVFLDQRYDWTPWGVLTGILIGFAGFFNLLWRTFVLTSNKSRTKNSDS